MAADPAPGNPVRARLRRRPGHRDRRRLDRETRPDHPRPPRHLAPRHRWYRCRWRSRRRLQLGRLDWLSRITWVRRVHGAAGAEPQRAPGQRRPRPTTRDAGTGHPARPALRVPRLPRRRPRLRPRPHRAVPAARRGRTTRTDPPRQHRLPLPTTPPTENLHRLDLPPHPHRPIPVDQPPRTHLPHLATSTPAPTAPRHPPAPTAEGAIPSTTRHTETLPGQPPARSGALARAAPPSVISTSSITRCSRSPAGSIS